MARAPTSSLPVPVSPQNVKTRVSLAATGVAIWRQRACGHCAAPGAHQLMFALSGLRPLAVFRLQPRHSSARSFRRVTEQFIGSMPALSMNIRALRKLRGISRPIS
jgi:hypothetical protein